MINTNLMGNKPIGTVGYLGGLMALPEEFCWSWGQMIQYNTEYVCTAGQYIHYDRAKASFHSFARNELVKNMLGDWILMLDTDHAFEPDIVGRMLYRMNRHNLDVLSGIYLYKYHPHSPVVYQHDENKNNMPMLRWDDADVFQISSSGAGCLLIKRSVFERIENELNEEPFSIEFPFGEDHSFFRRLDKLDIKAFCCPAIQANHLVVRELDIDKDFDTSYLNIEEGPTVIGYK